MLPFTRNRKLTLPSDSNDAAAQVMSSIKHSTFRLRRVPLKIQCFILVFCVLSVYLFGSIYLAWGHNRLTKEEFLEVRKCPACYGQSFCFSLFDDQFHLAGMSKYEMLDVVNVKNVHYAYHKNREHRVVLKKLAHNDEIRQVDDNICKDSVKDPGCDVSRRFAVSKTSQDIQRNGLQPSHFKRTTFMFMCPTYKLLDRVLNKYKEKRGRNKVITHDDKLQILFTAKVNAEPLMLQTFPSTEGWPFPEYLGACGRYIVEEYGGRSLEDFTDAPFEKRADLAYQMMKMAERLTADPEWNLYWTDLIYTNFAVDEGGRLMYIDTENIVVVDKESTKIANREHWDELSESQYMDCGEGRSNDCLTFDVKELCTHAQSDHNYYAACRNMLSSYADNRAFSGSPHLLHDIPAKVNEHWDLENLLNECVRPHYSQGRIKAAFKIIQALEHIRDGKPFQEPMIRHKENVVQKETHLA